MKELKNLTVRQHQELTKKLIIERVFDKRIFLIGTDHE